MLHTNHYKIKEISEVINGSTPSTKEDDNYDGDIIWLTPKDLSDQRTKYIYRGERNITKKGYDSCGTKMIPPDNIIMSSRAPIGLLSINKNECCTNQGFKSLILNKNLADTNYMYYFIKHHMPQIEALGSGTTFKEVSKDSMENYEIDIPDLLTQKKIADVLSCIDDKIALNNKTNTELENMAKTVYDYWFTQFDFPDKNGNPYKTSGGQMVYNEALKREIPVGWEVGKLSDIAYFLTETTGVENLQNYITTDNILPNKQGVTKAEFIPTYGNVLKYEEYDILIANIRPYFKKIWLSNTTGMCSNDVLCIKAKKSIYNFFLYRFLWRDDFFDYVMKGAKGSKMPRGDKKHIMSMPIPIPNNNTLLESFNAFYGPLQNQIWENQKENDELTNIRNYLLPLLMNGQIEVK
ncbi:MAG: restriction endonuclease subunit S [Treponema sp.]|nr:restriction endonuclease subunit S [Treponema sp.]